jgi:glutathione S-transferase
MPDGLTLYVCQMDQKLLAKVHPCAKAVTALRDNGHRFEKRIYGKGRPGGIGMKRPEIKQLSGQEKLPVLELPDGSAVAGSKDIVAWARETPATA